MKKWEKGVLNNKIYIFEEKQREKQAPPPSKKLGGGGKINQESLSL